MKSRVRVVISADSPEQLREIVAREEMDLNCGGARKGRAGDWIVEAYVAEEVVTRLQKAGARVEIDKDFDKRTAARRAEVGKGDRFDKGRTAPRGLGRKE